MRTGLFHCLQMFCRLNYDRGRQVTLFRNGDVLRSCQRNGCRFTPDLAGPKVFTLFSVFKQ